MEFLESLIRTLPQIIGWILIIGVGWLLFVSLISSLPGINPTGAEESTKPKEPPSPKPGPKPWQDDSTGWTSNYSSGDSSDEDESEPSEQVTEDDDGEEGERERHSPVSLNFRIQLVDMEGEPIEGRKVWVEYRVRTISARTDSDGWAEFEDVLFNPLSRVKECQAIGTGSTTLAENVELEDGLALSYSVDRD